MIMGRPILVLPIFFAYENFTLSSRNDSEIKDRPVLTYLTMVIEEAIIYEIYGIGCMLKVT